MLAHSTHSLVRGESTPHPESLDARLAAELNAMGEEAKLQILSRLVQRLGEQEKRKGQTSEITTSNTQSRRPVPALPKAKAPVPHTIRPSAPGTDVHVPRTAPKSADTISAPPTQLAAIANRSDIPSAQKHELMAKAILGELMPQTEAAAPAQAHAHAAEPADTHAADDPVAAMKRYMEANGELPPRAESKAPPPQLALDPEKIAPIGRDLAQLPHADRQSVLINLHDKLSHVIFEQGKILGPDGQLHVVSSPAEAAKLAQQIINDSITEHDQRTTQNQNTRIIPNQTPPLLPAITATPEAQAPAGARDAHIPEMGHGMTADSPAVRRVKAEARPVRGQEPTVKVKQEPPAAQAALTQPPAPVTPEAASRIGQRDPQSGRTILQPSNNLIQNERLANQAAPDLETRLSRITDSVPGAKFDRLRPQKGLERLQDKVADGKPPRTIGDNLAAQIVAPNVEAKNQLIARMRQEFAVLSVDDKFTEPRDKAGYPSTNVQVQMPNGGTAEVQIVTPEVQTITDQTHRLYTLGRGFPEGSPERAHYWDQAAAIHAQALEKFKTREARESQGRSQQRATAGQQPGGLAQRQRVVLKNGQTGKIVDFTKKFDRVVVSTSKGLRTVKPGDIRSRIDLSRRTVSSPDFEPRDLKKFTGKVESRLGAPEAQRGEIVLINTDALHEIQNALKDHSFAGVTLPGEVADDVIAKIRVRAEKTGREDLHLLADHMVRARSQYGVVPVALEGSNEAKNISADLEERIHGGQMDMGKGLLENYGDPEPDYAHPKTALFLPWLEARGVDPNDKVMAVVEIAALILRRENREAGVSDADAKQWIRSHFRTLREVHGDDPVQQFRRMIRRLLAARRQRRSR